MKTLTKAEEAFIDQYTRTLLIEWGVQTLSHGSFAIQIDAAPVIRDCCIEYASEKGWVSKAEPRRVLAKGFTVAASALKR